MAPKNPQNGHNEDAVALKRAQIELQVARKSVEQLLDMIRTGTSQQLEPLLAAVRSGVPREEILALVRQYTQDTERAESK
jgi:hypothetical protein